MEFRQVMFALSLGRLIEPLKKGEDLLKLDCENLDLGGKESIPLPANARRFIAKVFNDTLEPFIFTLEY